MSEKQSAHIRTVEDAKFPDLVQKWEVEAFPTMILVVDGKEEERVLGDIDPAWMGRVFNAASQKIISQEGKLLP
jgi:protein-disulfide isomerase-like protein with CxxC motif